MVRERTSAAELHHRDLPTHRRAIHLVEVTAPALVLGSTQPDEDVDRLAADAEGIEVVRRRSGGGAVLLVPDGQVWVDVIVPRHDPLWDDDVARATHWLGAAWASALSESGIPGGTVHRGAMISTALSPVVCFASLGPGEVSVDGAKCVGISQRRTREAARFQCSIPFTWDADLHVRLLSPGLARVGVAAGDVAGLAVRTVPPAELLDALLAAIPR